MWQRIQTVFLGLVVVCMVGGMLMPVWYFTDAATGIEHQLYPLHYTQVVDGTRATLYFPYYLMALLMAAAATVAVLEIRRYDNRFTQIKLGTLNSMLLALVMISMIVFSHRLASDHYGWKYGLALYLAFGGVAFNWLAIRFIRRDEKLVRDSERLR
jgi:glucan phosphoethanolaminetransferase (alkaline phosphatase superfamily)